MTNEQEKKRKKETVFMITYLAGGNSGFKTCFYCKMFARVNLFSTLFLFICHCFFLFWVWKQIIYRSTKEDCFNLEIHWKTQNTVIICMKQNHVESYLDF